MEIEGEEGGRLHKRDDSVLRDKPASPCFFSLFHATVIELEVHVGLSSSDHLLDVTFPQGGA